MSDLLTHAEYKAIAANIDLPKTPYIDGKFRAGRGKKMKSVNPATGKVIAEIKTASKVDVDLAVQKAREAFDQGHWSRAHPSERKDALIKLCKYMTRRKHELAVMESLESGKPILDCQTVDLPEAIHTIKWHAEAADKIYDQTSPTGDDAISMIVREPLGVVVAVLPWNFPMLMLAWKIGPALAAGCSVIVKPAEQTSMTALRIAELCSMAGIPRGVIQVLPGDGPSVGEPLGRHMDVDMVTFTGSTETGRRFLTYAGESNLKKVTLECGGKNPAVVLADAENLDHVAEHVVKKADKRAKDEIFGPVLSVIEVSSTDEAIELANATEYGLAASVFTANTRSAIRAARAIKAGTVSVNCYGEGDIATPFGGYKMSGFGGRDNGMHAHDQYTEVKTIWIDLTDPADGDNVG